MTQHFNGITNIAVVFLPVTCFVTLGTDELTVAPGAAAGQHSISIAPKWEAVVSLGHVQAKQLMLSLAQNIAAHEKEHGEIKIPSAVVTALTPPPRQN